MHARHLPSYSFQRERWRNGAGWTRQVWRQPDDGDGFAWRASIAEIDHDGRFSTFPGCDRQLVLLAGDGGTLQFDDGRSLALEPPHGRVQFAGEDAPSCHVASRLQAFNLIVQRSHAVAELFYRPLVGPMVFLPEPEVQWLALLVAGRAALPDARSTAPLETGDALLLWPEARAPQRLVLSGGGEVLLARIAARPPG